MATVTNVDTDDMPYNRNVLCMNCGYGFGDHAGWRCDNLSSSGDMEYSKCARSKRYLTPDMLVTGYIAPVPSSAIIYKDTYIKPQIRVGDPDCLNCKARYHDHIGWLCAAISGKTVYDYWKLSPNLRYLTVDMQDPGWIPPKDPATYIDTDEFPEERAGEECINCNKTFALHDHWRCPGLSGPTRYSKLGRYNAYYTHDMTLTSWGIKKSSIVNAPSISQAVAVQVDLTKDPTHWKAWAHNVKGDCACGINRKDCNFHR